MIARPPSRLSRHNAADIRDSASRAHARLLDHQASGGFAEVSNAVADPTRISATRISPAAVADLEATARVRALALQALSSVDPAIVGRTYVHPRVGTVSSADLVGDDGTQADPSSVFESMDSKTTLDAASADVLLDTLRVVVAESLPDSSLRSQRSGPITPCDVIPASANTTRPHSDLLAGDTSAVPTAFETDGGPAGGSVLPPVPLTRSRSQSDPSAVSPKFAAGAVGKIADTILRVLSKACAPSIPHPPAEAANTPATARRCAPYCTLLAPVRTNRFR